MQRGGEGWDGDSWQAYCDTLLALHHRDAYQTVPAADRGDCGIEGHSTDGQGCAYQCYAADPEISIAERRKRQVAKITETVGTLVRSRDRLAQVIGEHTINQLIFLFPRHDSADVNAHLHRQEARLRTEASTNGMTCIAADVVLTVWTIPPHLEAERTELERVGATLARLPDVQVTDAEKEQYRQEAADALPRAQEKLGRRFGQTRAPELMEITIEDLLIGSQQEAALQDLPDLYERYERLKRTEQRNVRRMSAEGTTSGLTLDGLIDRLRGQITAEVPGVHSGDAKTLAAGTLASWLVECPLDFQGPGQ